jgi:2'-5' RNA ligase
VRRLFFALWPTGDAAERLGAASAPYLAGLDARIVAPADLHVTLGFLGLLDQAQEALIVQRAGDLGATGFTLCLESLEYWSGAQVLALAASRVPGAASELARQLRRLAHECGCPAESAAWRAHMTLARHVPPALLRCPAWPMGPGRGPSVRLAAQHFFLVQSQPAAPRYQRLYEWPLRSPAD